MINELINEFFNPARIVAASDNVENGSAILDNYAQQVFLTEKNFLTCKGKGYIILDFGREICGGIRLLTFRFSERVISAKIRIRFGESVNETCAEMGEKHAGNHHSVRDLTVDLPALCDQTFGDTGFRFVRIDFLEDVVYNVINAYASAWRRDLNFVGNFCCDDCAVNDIFDVARYTVYTTMQKNLWEGVKRDRLIWVGDMYPQVKAITDVFGQSDLVENAIRLSVENNPLPCWFGNIPAYSFWFILILSDYYDKVGNKSFVAEFFPYIDGILHQLDACVDESGDIDFSRSAAPFQHGFFIDWPSVNNAETKAGNAFLFIYAINRLKRLYDDFALPVNPLCDKLIKKLSALTFSDLSLKQVVALGYLAGKIPKKEAAEKLLVGGAKGVSAFMSYFILKAVAESAGTDKAIDIMKDYYGGMLSRGATTFWEDFDIDWLAGSGSIDELTPPSKKDIHGDFGKHCYKGFRHSLCHGWSCGPVQFLLEDVMGIRVIESGCKTLAIRPSLGNLNGVKGSFPTPFGVVSVECVNEDGKVKTIVNTPADIKIIS